MRPFVFFSIFTAAAFVAADHTVLIDNLDKQISYSNGWKSINSDLGDGATWSINDKGSGTASLRVYNASRIAVRVFVEASGQVVRISLDNQNYDVTPSLYQQPAWTSGILDPSVPHDLIIIKRNPDGQYIGLDSILVTHYDPPTTTRDQATATAVLTSNVSNQLTPSAAPPAAAAPPSTQTKSMGGGTFSSGRIPSDSSPELYTGDASSETNAWSNSDDSHMSGRATQSTVQSEPSAPSSFTSLLIPQATPTSSEQQPNTEPVLSGGKLAAVILACIAAPALVIGGIILYRRRRLGKRKAASTAYLEWMAAHGHVPPRPLFPPTSPDEKFGGAEGLTQLGSPTSDSIRPHTVSVALGNQNF